MKINGFIVAGLVITAVGWLWLGVGASVEGGRYGFEQIYNVHLGTMAQMCINLGYTMLIVGTLISGFLWLKPMPVIDGEAAAATGDLSSRDEAAKPSPNA